MISGRKEAAFYFILRVNSAISTKVALSFSFTYSALSPLEENCDLSVTERDPNEDAEVGGSSIRGNISDKFSPS